MLAHCYTSRRLWIYTDACNDIWSGSGTKIKHEDHIKPHDSQRHNPLPFISGWFAPTQVQWNLLEKEAYAVVARLEGWHGLAATTEGIYLDTYHKNSILIFTRLVVLPDFAHSSISTVLRWAVHLTLYNYTCSHITATHNRWDELLGSWATPPIIRRLIKIQTLPKDSSDDFDLSTNWSVQVSQESHSTSHLPNETYYGLYSEEERWLSLDSRWCTPPASSSMQ